MRAIKIVVIALGIALIGGFTVFGYVLVQRLGTVGKTVEQAAAGRVAPAPGGDRSWRRSIGLAENEAIFAVTGSADRILVTIGAEETVSRVVIVEAKTGRIAGEIIASE